MKLFIAIALALITLPACKKTANTADYEANVKKSLTEAGLKPDKVSCPKDVAMKEGNVFNCTITVEGKDYKLETTIGKIKDNHADTSERWPDGPPPGLGGGPAPTDDPGDEPEDK